MATAWKIEVLYMPDEREADPFQYGWRYVRRVDEHGHEIVDQVPRTLIDGLHPYAELAAELAVERAAGATARLRALAEARRRNGEP